MKIVIQGGDRASKRIRELANRYRKFSPKKDLQEALLKAGFLLEGEAKRQTPVDTGRLRASIYVTPRMSLGNAYVEVGPHTDYGLYVHEGTRWMRARPFMEWGLRAAGNGIEKVFKKIGSSVSISLTK